LPVLKTPWQELRRDEGHELDRWLEQRGVERPVIDPLITRPEPVALRWLEPPFYPRTALVEIWFDDRFEQGGRLVTQLVQTPGTEAEANDDDDPAVDDRSATKIYPLNGTSPPIHEANVRLPLALPDVTTAEEYLRFFGGYVWGEEGGFWIVERADQIPWSSQAEQELRERADDAITPIVPQPQDDDGRFRFTTTTLYSNALFTAEYAIAPTGMVEMLDDEPLLADLPIRADRRDRGLRLTPAP
jgi:hypothetical protein